MCISSPKLHGLLVLSALVLGLSAAGDAEARRYERRSRPQADIAVSATLPQNLTPGSTASATMSLTNHGPSDVSYAYAYVRVPQGVRVTTGKKDSCRPYYNGRYYYCRFNGVKSGETVDVPYEIDVSTSVQCNKKVRFVTYGNGGAWDKKRKNNRDFQNVEVTCEQPEKKADVSVFLSAPEEVDEGNPVDFHVLVSNAGPNKAKDIEVRSIGQFGLTFNKTRSSSECSLVGSDVVCTLKNLKNGADTAVAISYDTTLPCGALIENQVTAKPQTLDPNLSNNTSAYTETDIVCAPEPEPFSFNVVEKSIRSADSTVSNDQNITLLRFETLGDENVAVDMTNISFAAKKGSLLNADNYSIWVDTNFDGVVDVVAEDGVVAKNGTVSFFGQNVSFIHQPQYTTIFEVRADVAQSLTSDELQLGFATNESGYISLENRDTGEIYDNVSTDGSCAVDQCDIHVSTAESTHWTFSKNGDLYVTQSSIPTLHSQHLGGTLEEPALILDFRADKEPIDVYRLSFLAENNQADGIDSLELSFEANGAPFARATEGNCQALGVTGNFCVPMHSRQLIVGENDKVTVYVRPRLKTDINDAFSGEKYTLYLEKSSHVAARGDFSARNLEDNDGDSVAEGEVFVGTEQAGPNGLIASTHTVVLSKISSIKNAGPSDAALSPGIQTIGSFRFSAESNENTKNGRNTVQIDGLVFSVIQNDNVEVATSMRAYNANDPFNATTCVSTALDGRQVGKTATESLLVICEGLTFEVDSGKDAVIELSTDIVQTNVNANRDSELQVSLTDITDVNKTVFGNIPNASHVKWWDRDGATSTRFTWFDLPETVFKSTAFSS